VQKISITPDAFSVFRNSMKGFVNPYLPLKKIWLAATSRITFFSYTQAGIFTTELPTKN